MPKVIEIGSGQSQHYNPDLSPELSIMLHWQVESEQMEAVPKQPRHMIPSMWGAKAMMLVAPCPPFGLLYMGLLVMPRVGIHELFSSQDTLISPVCQISLKKLFSRISLFHFYTISFLGQVMK